jgi:hypothetical protein
MDASASVPVDLELLSIGVRLLVGLDPAEGAVPSTGTVGLVVSAGCDALSMELPPRAATENNAATKRVMASCLTRVRHCLREIRVAGVLELCSRGALVIAPASSR